MRRIFILAAFFSCMFRQVMANNVMIHDTISIHDKSLSQREENADKNFIKPETYGIEIRNIDAPENLFNFIIDDSCENICFLSKDTTATNKKKKKAKNVLLTVKRISDDKILYSKSFQWEGQKFVLSKTSLTEILFNSTSITNLETVEQQILQGGWKSLGYVNDNVILYKQVFSTKVAAYSMKEGEEVWQQSKFIDGDNGMVYCQPIDEVTDYIVSKDLVRINWETGDIKSLDCKTSITNKKMVLASALVGIAAGVVGGVAGTPVFYPIYTKNTDYRRSFFIAPGAYTIAGLNSNVIQKSGKNYFADRNSLHCFDNDMNETWSVKLPEKATRSELFFKGDTICMVNLAEGLYGSGGTKSMEKPYVATCTIDGRWLSYQSVEMEDQKVMSYISFDDHMHLLFLDKEAICNTASNTIDMFDTDTTLIGSLKYYVGEGQLYKLDSDKSFSGIKSTKNSILVRTGNGYVVEVKNGKTTILANPSEVYNVIATNGDKTFIVGQKDNFKELWLIKNGEAVLVNDRIKSIRIKYRHLILSTDNAGLQILSY